MPSFDCTSLECPLFGPHLLEASAGTGKTFAIEHVFVRLLLESKSPSLELEQILAVTFTKAAARELKNRIRSALEKAVFYLENPRKEGLPYLSSFVGDTTALAHLQEALSCFESAQIFTIHGFCYRALKEFSFEGRLDFSLSNPGEEAHVFTRLKQLVNAFLEKEVDPALLCPQQFLFLLREYGSLEALGEKIVKAPIFKHQSLSFEDLLKKAVKAAELLFPFHKTEGELMQEFQRLAPFYKVAIKGNFERQIKALSSLIFSSSPAESFQDLIREKGTLFMFLSPENRKVRTEDKPFPSPFFKEACRLFSPIIREATDLKGIFQTLVQGWQKRAQEIGERKHWTPDILLHQMQEAISHLPFRFALQKKYQALIVDEFQDTDPLQWEIFKTLFLDKPDRLRALYLVGDPKQSIYRFRNADVYTYFKAKRFLGSSALYSLDTNYRSSEPLVKTLNTLFAQVALPLPKLKETIPYVPVKARTTFPPIPDGKGAVHAMVAEGGQELFETTFLPYAVKEIERLIELGFSASSIAILVKDRHQGTLAFEALRARGLRAFVKSSESLGETEAFRVYKELFYALVFPKEAFRMRLVEKGPFGLQTLPTREDLEKGLLHFFSRLSQSAPAPLVVSDVHQIMEELLGWEQREGFSADRLLSFFDELSEKGPEEGGRRLIEPDEAAIQILTMHISKGLEFDVVMALGVSSSQPSPIEEEEELRAELLRQLYVAMTRAKLRLYIPIRTEMGKNPSPMDLFYAELSSKGEEPFSSLAKTVSFTFEKVEPTSLTPKELVLPVEEGKTKSYSSPIFTPRWIRSFTSLTKEKEEGLRLEKLEEGLPTVHNMPRGAQTGVLIHSIFERLFSTFDWDRVDLVVEQILKGTPLQPWIIPVQVNVKRALHLPFLPQGGSLALLKKGQARPEIPFLYGDPPHIMKGVLDLLFFWEGRFYLLDWKTNWLGKDESCYQVDHLRVVMEQEDYFLQGAIYREALERYLRLAAPKKNEKLFGGAYYVFFRANAIYHFIPRGI